MPDVFLCSYNLAVITIISIGNKYLEDSSTENYLNNMLVITSYLKTQLYQKKKMHDSDWLILFFTIATGSQ